MFSTDSCQIAGRVLAVSLLVSVAQVAAAQELSITSASMSARVGQESLTSASAQSAQMQREPQPVVVSNDSGRGPFIPLYVTFGVLQALDVHSTLRAVEAGAVEQNPILRGAVNNPAALIAVKAGVGAATVLIADKLRTRNRVAAFVVMAAVNSAYATVVAHNYSAR